MVAAIKPSQAALSTGRQPPLSPRGKGAGGEGAICPETPPAHALFGPYFSWARLRGLIALLAYLNMVCIANGEEPTKASLDHSAQNPPAWPLWDGKESVETYANRAGLVPTRSLDLGNGVTLDLVLIPAGRFIMGTPDNPGRFYENSSEPGKNILKICGTLAGCMLLRVAVQTIRQRRRPTFSLAWLILLVVQLGGALYGIVRWYQASLVQEEAWVKR